MAAGPAGPVGERARSAGPGAGRLGRLFGRWLWEGRLDRKGRLLVAAAALAVALSLLGPLWSLRLVAPQYREGLPLHVYAWGVGGRLDTINVLNHYIGMKPIRPEDFREFRYLPWLFGAAFVSMAAAALTGWRWIAGLLAVLSPGLLVFVFDLWRWLYRYGHQLDPAAPIRVEPFTPPLMGSYRLANFTTFSYFNWGTLLQLVALALILAALARSGTAALARQRNGEGHRHTKAVQRRRPRRAEEDGVAS